MAPEELIYISVISFIFAILGFGLAMMGSWIGFAMCMACIVIFIISEKKLNH